MKPQHGFTLIEVMVALSIMAVMAGMAWAGLDVLLRSRNAVHAQGRHVAQLQIALQQWTLDLDQAWMPEAAEPMGWDGKVFRLTRRAVQPEQGLVVVAWAVRSDGQQSQLMRWQSAPLTQLAQWRQAWEQAALWGRSSGGSRQAVALLPAGRMDIFVWSGQAWVNGQSSDRTATDDVQEGSLSKGSKKQPRGLRLQLTMDEHTLVCDWGALTLGGGAS